MRLLNYLREKYVDTIKTSYGKDNVEIFINPSTKELNDIKNQEGGVRGYRFIVDLDKKDLYVANNIVIHADMFGHISAINKISSYQEYFTHGSNRLFTGNSYPDNFDNIESDTFSHLFDRLKQFDESIYNNVVSLRSKDFSWLSRWMKPKDVTDIIDKCIKNMERLK